MSATVALSQISYLGEKKLLRHLWSNFSASQATIWPKVSGPTLHVSAITMVMVVLQPLTAYWTTYDLGYFQTGMH